MVQAAVQRLDYGTCTEFGLLIHHKDWCFLLLFLRNLGKIYLLAYNTALHKLFDPSIDYFPSPGISLRGTDNAHSLQPAQERTDIPVFFPQVAVFQVQQIITPGTHTQQEAVFIDHRDLPDFFFLSKDFPSTHKLFPFQERKTPVDGDFDLSGFFCP